MSLRTLETAIVAGARIVLNNPKLRLKDLLEWRTSKLEPQDGEVTIRVDDPAVWATFPASCDKRAK